jgi:hypothetical protein
MAGGDAVGQQGGGGAALAPNGAEGAVGPWRPRLGHVATPPWGHALGAARDLSRVSATHQKLPITNCESVGLWSGHVATHLWSQNLPITNCELTCPECSVTNK